jgi:hypothetical protein
MSDEFVLNELGIKQYIPKNYNFFKEYNDIKPIETLKSLPVFVLVFEQDLAKSYLYNLYGFLKTFDYPIFWVYRDGQTDIKSYQMDRIIVLGPDKTKLNRQLYTSINIDMNLLPTEEFKKSLWMKISPYVDVYKNLRLPKENSIAKVYIDRELTENIAFGKWALNLFGFLSFNQISVDYADISNEKNVVDDSLLISFKDSKLLAIKGNHAKLLLVDPTQKPDTQKSEIFSSLINNGYIQIDSRYEAAYTYGPKLM